MKAGLNKSHPPPAHLRHTPYLRTAVCAGPRGHKNKSYYHPFEKITGAALLSLCRPIL